MRFLGKAAGLAFALAGAAALYNRLSLRSVINSDGANEALQGLDFWHGNVLLHGWWLAQDTFYLTDAPLYGLITRLQGLGPWVVHEGAGLVYGLAVLVAALLARGREPGQRGWAAAAFAGALLALPPALLLQGQMHILGVVFVLAGVLWIERRPGQAWPLVGAGLLLAAATASDPLMALLFVPAIGLAGAARALRPGPESRRWQALVGVVLLAAIATRGLPKLVAVLGGFERPRALSVGLVTPGQLPHNLALATRGLLLVFDADVFDAPHDAIVWIHLLAVAAVLAALVAGVRHLRSSALEDFVPQVLLIVCALDLAVFVFTSQPFDLASSRFLSPFAICGAALAGRMLAPLVDSPRVLAPAAAAAALLLLTVPVQLSRPPAAVPTARVESWLEARGLTRGLGAYWESSIVTLDTGGRVTVRCVDGPTALERRARPDRWFQNQAWFAPQAGGPADFVVFSPGEHTANINEAGAIEAFGQPIEIDHIGPYEVMVYSRDLTPELGP